MTAIAGALSSRAFASDSVRTALFALAYLAGAELGYALSLGSSVGGTFWPPAGIALAVFVTVPWRSVPVLIAAGAAVNFVSDLVHGQTLPAAFGFTIANLGEPLLGAAIVRALLPDSRTFVRLSEAVVIVLVTVVVSAPVASFVGGLTAERFTVNPPGIAASWQTWWVGDAVGALVLAPCVLQLLARWRRTAEVRAHTWLEALAFLAAVALVADLVFAASTQSVAMPFLMFPVLLWGSLRLGPVAVGAGLCLLVALAARSTAAGQGPFALEELSLGERLVALQVYVGVMAAMFHAMALLWQERLRAAAELQQAHSGLEARYRRIVEQSPLAVVAIGTGGRVKEVNPAWLRLRAAAAQPAGRGLTEEPLLQPFIERAFAGEIVELPEVSLGVEEGRTVRGFAYPIKDEAGGVGEVVLIVRDTAAEREAQRALVDANQRLQRHELELSRALAEMKEAERHRDQLLAAERFARGEAERASQLKDQFLATLSHELRTPLNAIVGWAHVLLRTVRDPSLTRAAETIERNAKTQARLIDDLLDMSRILAGKVGLTLAPTRLDEVVAGAVDALRPSAEAKGVALEIVGASAPALVVLGDAARLQQVVTNLLGNGIKFTDRGGRVAVRVSKRGAHGCIEVIDSGEGIPREFIGDVFERFRQADGSITRRHGGLGLGLSIAKHIVEMHGGTIAAESEGIGQGAKFTLLLPLAPGSAATDLAVDAPAEAVANLTRLRILVVDDEPDARDLLHRLLLEHGCAVATAASAEMAIEALAHAPYDVLLSDIGMPGTDGYALLRRIREGGLPVGVAVAVTAFARPEDRVRVLEAGFHEHLVKPIDPSHLTRVLADAAKRLPI
jgi:signal transduction histidine kinase/integral membrane sensor domain MASE1/ActR/RegA family two-component response regulator